MMMGRYSDYFNQRAESEKRPPAKTPDNVYYHFLSGLNKARIGGNTSVLEVTYKNGSALRCMVDPGDMFGDKNNPEHPALTWCDSVITDMREYFDHTDDKGNEIKATKPLDSII